MKMVTVFNEHFLHPDKKNRFTIYFGGNGEKAGAPLLHSVFFPEDVTQLVYNSYKEAILDGSFFAHDTLVKQYFEHTHDVKALFKRICLV